MGEERVRFWAENMGWDVERAPRGQDFQMSKRDPLTGRKKSIRVEVKTRNAGLSPLQKKTRATHRGRYHVVSGDSLLDGFDGLLSDAAAKKSTGYRGRQTAPKKMPRRKSVFSL